MNPANPVFASTLDRAPLFKYPHLIGVILGCLFLGFVSVPAIAQSVNEACWYTQGRAGTVTFNSGTTNTGSTGNTINLTPGTAVGTVLWTSNTAALPNPPTMRCSGNAVPSGIVNQIAGPPTNGTTLFPTNIPGISYELLHPDATTLLSVYPNYLITNGDTSQGTQFNVATNVKLIYTGPYLPPAGTYALTGALAQWNVDTCSQTSCFNFPPFINNTVSAQPVEYFNISVTISVVVPTCSLAGPADFTVPLPNVTTTQFTGQGSAPTGQSPTPFNIQLTGCPRGEKVYVTFNTANPAGATGVIAPAGAGFATGVGVQILQANGSTPVTFGTAINTGTTTTSNYTVGLYARYYQTGTTASAGPVQGKATYTLNYQ